MAHVQINCSYLRAIEKNIAAERKAGLFRPTVVAVLQCIATGQFLMVQMNPSRYWAFVQGGIEADEGVIDALAREVWEETEIPPHLLTVRKFCLADQNLIPNFRRDGYTGGKSLYYFYVTCETLPEVKVDGKENIAYRWVSPKEAVVSVLSLRTRLHLQKKSDGMLFALNSALRS